MDDASKIQASIDGESTSFTVTPVGEAWALYFSYPHSTHEVVFSLNSQNDATQSPDLTATPTPTPIPELTFTIAAIACIVLLAVALIAKRKRR